MKKIILMSISLIAFSFEAYGVDAIKCKRERPILKPIFRQFCSIDEEVKTVAIDLGSTINYNGSEFHISNLLEKPEALISTSSGGIDSIELYGLYPRLKFIADWNRSKPCLRSPLWSNRVSINISNTDKNQSRYLDSISLGYGYYDLDLSIVDLGGFKPWNVEQTIDETIKITTEFFLQDQDHRPGSPLPYQRIPTNCTLDIRDLHLGFDSARISRNLATLKVLVNNFDKLLVKSSIIHANLIDEQKGAICSVYKLASTLREVELLTIDDSWDLLSEPSKAAIITGLEKADEIGAINLKIVPEESKNYWEHFTSTEFQSMLSSSCHMLESSKYIVSTDSFMNGDSVVNWQGYQNALDYFREKENLQNLMTGAWALIEAGKLEVNQSSELSWILNPTIYQHLQEQQIEDKNDI